MEKIEHKVSPAEKWLAENIDQWYVEGEEMKFLIPIDQVPDYVLDQAKVYKQILANSQRRNKILHSLNIGNDTSWE